MKILPQDFLYEDVGDTVRVKTDVEKDLITPELLLPHIRHNRLGAGTIIKIQIMSKDRNVLLHTADFVIERAVEEVKRIIDERGERSARITTYSVVQDTPWKSYAEEVAPVMETPERVPEKYVPGEAEQRWNPGKQVREIIVAGKVIAELTKREDETTDEFKARALAIAAGSEPLAA